MNGGDTLNWGTTETTVPSSYIQSFAKQVLFLRFYSDQSVTESGFTIRTVLAPPSASPTASPSKSPTATSPSQSPTTTSPSRSPSTLQ